MSIKMHHQATWRDLKINVYYGSMDKGNDSFLPELIHWDGLVSCCTSCLVRLHEYAVFIHDHALLSFCIYLGTSLKALFK